MSAAARRYETPTIAEAIAVADGAPWVPVTFERCDHVVGPFFHGTRAAIPPGHLITAGWPSNYRPDVIMNHVYFTALRDGAGLAAEIAAVLGPEGSEPHVYLVTPTGPFEDDPNVTDRKLPGNPTRSYRTRDPLVVVEEIPDWVRLTHDALETWRERLRSLVESQAEIIN